MSRNRFYTILIVPEKTTQTRRIIIPAWLFRGSIVGAFFAVALGLMMLFDYWYVMGQIEENKQLRLENRRLKAQVQVFKNKSATIESTLDRVKTFAARLRVITNLEDRGNLISQLNEKLPDSATNISETTPLTPPIDFLSPQSPVGAQSVAQPQGSAESNPNAAQSAVDSNAAPTSANQEISSLGLPASNDETALWQDEDPETAKLRKEYAEMDMRFSQLNYEALYVEQVLQDQYELLADQKAFLAALPTRKPAVGYFTSGFGVRKSPFGGREKMHEGLDIANQPGTPIRATADGVVVHADAKPGYGQTVIIDHGYGLETWYAHARKINVTRGQKVKRGDSIATLGSSGRSTGPHLHYEVRVHGTPVDPLSYILEN